MKKTFLYFTLFVLVSNIFAQKKHINFEKLSIEEGLSQSSVNCILQDKKGFMWFGTLDGLNKYNGYEIKTYRNSLSDPNSISDNTITSLFEDSYGLLWIGTHGNGVSIYDRFQDNFIPIQRNKSANSLVSNSVTAITQDVEGNIWVGALYGLSKLSKKFNKIEFTNFKKYSGLPADKVNVLLADKSGNIWIATDKGLASYNIYETVFKLHHANGIIGSKKINSLCLDKNDILWLGTDEGLIKYFKSSGIAQYYENQYFPELRKSKINALLSDSESILWVGTTNDGLFQLDSKNQKINNFKYDATDNKSISVNEILSIYQDNAGIIWIGTSLGGINKWNKLNAGIEIYKHNVSDDNSLSSNLVRTFFQDKNGTIWIGTVDGGLNKWEKENQKFIAYKNNPNDYNSLSNNHIRAIYEDSKNRLWIGTDGGGLNLMDKNTGKFKVYKYNANDKNCISNDNIWGIYEHEENLLLATFGGGITVFNADKNTFKVLENDSTNVNSLSDNRVTCFFKDSKSNFWVGTYGGGLNLFIPETGIFHRFQHDKKNPKTIANDRIYCVFEDSNGELWVGTKGGLNKFDPENNTFVRLTEKNGLPNDVVLGILEDSAKNLWFSTNQGISKFNIETFSIRNYNVIDGLQSNEFLVGSYCKINTGEMLFGGINGFNMFHPAKMSYNFNFPKISITAFKILNNEVKLDSAISEKKRILLDWKSNNISFEFVALDYTFSKKNQYAYMLEGFETKWNYVKNRRFASYTNLPSGTYLFKVKGSNNDGIWNEKGTEIKIIIKPAIWQTAFFQIITLLIIIASIYFFIRIRMKSIKLKKIELDMLVNKQTEKILADKKSLSEQMQLIAFQRQEINDSLIFAKQLQLTNYSSLNKNNKTLKDYFVYSKPKNEVSSDFYWIRRKDNTIILTVIDCISCTDDKFSASKLASSFLNNYVNKKDFENTGKLLSNLAKTLYNTFKNQKYDNQSILKVSIETAICIIDLDKNIIEFAGANMPLYRIQNNKLSIVEGNTKAITFGNDISSYNFETQEIKLVKGDIFYLFTDGYAKQTNQDDYSTFNYKRFRDLLLEIHEFPMDIQKNTLDKNIENWRKNNELSDDILVIGVKI